MKIVFLVQVLIDCRLPVRRIAEIPSLALDLLVESPARGVVAQREVVVGFIPAATVSARRRFGRIAAHGITSLVRVLGGVTDTRWASPAGVNFQPGSILVSSQVPALHLVDFFRGCV